MGGAVFTLTVAVALRSQCGTVLEYRQHHLTPLDRQHGDERLRTQCPETTPAWPTTVDGAPTITAIADQTIVEDTATAALPFTIADVETAAAGLTLSVSRPIRRSCPLPTSSSAARAAVAPSRSRRPRTRAAGRSRHDHRQRRRVIVERHVHRGGHGGQRPADDRRDRRSERDGQRHRRAAAHRRRRCRQSRAKPHALGHVVESGARDQCQHRVRRQRDQSQRDDHAAARSERADDDHRDRERRRGVGLDVVRPDGHGDPAPDLLPGGGRDGRLLRRGPADCESERGRRARDRDVARGRRGERHRDARASRAVGDDAAGRRAAGAGGRLGVGAGVVRQRPAARGRTHAVLGRHGRTAATRNARGPGRRPAGSSRKARKAISTRSCWWRIRRPRRSTSR